MELTSKFLIKIHARKEPPPPVINGAPWLSIYFYTTVARVRNVNRKKIPSHQPKIIESDARNVNRSTHVTYLWNTEVCHCFCESFSYIYNNCILSLQFFACHILYVCKSRIRPRYIFSLQF